jgi:hypothetical protein
MGSNAIAALPSGPFASEAPEDAAMYDELRKQALGTHRPCPFD